MDGGRRPATETAKYFPKNELPDPVRFSRRIVLIFEYVGHKTKAIPMVGSDRRNLPWTVAGDRRQDGQLFSRFHTLEENPSAGSGGEMVQNSNEEQLLISEGNSDMEPYLGMQFESEEAAKVFYDAYATRLGFIMRVDAFRRSMRDGKVVWRRLVCNKEGFRKCRPRRSEGRKPRAVTREGCKAMIVVKKEKTGKWVVTRFVKEHSHPLVVAPANSRRSVLLSQTPMNSVKKAQSMAPLHCHLIIM
ncbi:protein FAR1-RELATED SEQUENCE 5 isoform X3 [Diospyros lotus]|uniref:protein FAR1-RELATED SEQUENCE 5 isoform X3 n=1 Tax=Diospyros lotus TaxID=55363 RepID=UPI00225138BF|nr:protein FAR1-RELATED SEQUENCE 5 isoform X3 [Diospyros lotus]